MSLTTIRNIFGRLFDALFGNPDRFELEHRLFNASCFMGAVTLGVAGLINLFIDIALWLRLYPLAGVPALLAFYYLGRKRETYRVLVWPLVLFLLLGLVANWIGNGGSRGPITMFFIVAGSASFLLLHGVSKILLTFLYIATLVGLFALEHHQQQWLGRTIIRPYPSETERLADLTAGSILCMLVTVSLLHVIARNFRDIFEKLQEYKTHFYEDLVLARILQRRVYEYDEKVLEGYQHSLVYQPSAELSGDLYDFTREGDRLRLFLADSKGHGINSSLSAMIIKSEWMSLNRFHLPPGDCMSMLNQRITQRYGDSISFSAIIVDITPQKIDYASAGHVSQYIVDNGQIRELEATGAPVGLLDDTTYPGGQTSFSSGAQLILFTDALTEETDPRGRPVGHDWLVELLLSKRLESAEATTTAIMHGLAKLKGQNPKSLSCRDDLTLLAVKLR